MKFLSQTFIFLILFSVPVFVWAATSVINLSDDPFFIKPIEDVVTKTNYYGNLQDHPHLYEFRVEEDTTLSAAISAPERLTNEPRFSGIVVRVEERRGVTEIGRLRRTDASWEPYREAVTGESLLEGPSLTAELTAGLYRLEVSTPENQGKYVLSLGTEPAGSGYFTQVADVWRAKQFYERSIFSMLGVSLIYAPLGIIIVLLLFYYTWRSRKKAEYVA